MKIRCALCGVETEVTSSRQRYCPSCSEEIKAVEAMMYHNVHPTVQGEKTKAKKYKQRLKENTASLKSILADARKLSEERGEYISYGKYVAMFGGKK